MAGKKVTVKLIYCDHWCVHIIFEGKGLQAMGSEIKWRLEQAEFCEYINKSLIVN
jgi:hypothetical protein